MRTQALRAIKRAVQKIPGKASTVLVVQPGAGLPVPASTSTASSNDQSNLQICHRANAVIATLKEILAHSEPVQHWGINE